MGQEEELRPYSELPCGNMDTQVTENEEPEQDDIQESETGRKYNRVVDTWVLNTRKTKVTSCIIRVRPCYSTNSSASVLPNL